MQDYTITGEQLQAFRQRLVWEEKSPATIEKYLRDAADFTAWLDGRAASKAAAGAGLLEIGQNRHSDADGCKKITRHT